MEAICELESAVYTPQGGLQVGREGGRGQPGRRERGPCSWWIMDGTHTPLHFAMRDSELSWSQCAGFYPAVPDCPSGCRVNMSGRRGAGSAVAPCCRSFSDGGLLTPAFHAPLMHGSFCEVAWLGVHRALTTLSGRSWVFYDYHSLVAIA